MYAFKAWVAASALVAAAAVMSGAGWAQPDDRPPNQPRALVEVTKLPPPDLSRLRVATVARLVQADLVLVDLDGKEVAVRLCGVEAPAAGDTGGAGDPHGERALEFASNLLTGERVYLDPHADAEYERSHLDRLFYVYRHPDGLFVNAELVRLGYARCDKAQPGRYAEVFAALQDRAKLARKGLWGTSKAKSAATPVPVPMPAPQPATKRPAAATPAQPAAGDDASVTVYCTRTGSKYHTAGCSYLRSSSIPISLKDARAKGLTPCSRCHPPG